MKRKFILIALLTSSMYANVTIATTTSLNNIKLFDNLKKELKKENIDIRWVPTGSTKAILMGVSCDVDVVFSHAKKVEEKYIKTGDFISRNPIMYDFFTLIGPKKIQSNFLNKNIGESFKYTYNNHIPFVSRGDASGTNIKELNLWHKYTTNIPKLNYIQSGSGMMNTINIADTKNAITLSDIGSFMMYKNNIKSDIISYKTKGDELKNIYSLLVTNPKKCKMTNYNDIKKFKAFVLSDKFKKIVKNIKINNKNVIFNLK